MNGIRKSTRRFFLALALFAALPASAATRDDDLYQLLRTDLPAFAREVSRDESSELGRSQAIVRWLAKNFAWLGTDYQKRTVQQIVERKGGNCNDLAMVATSAMRALGMRLRHVHEVNLQAPSDERESNARTLIASGSSSTTRSERNGCPRIRRAASSVSTTGCRAASVSACASRSIRSRTT